MPNAPRTFQPGTFHHIFARGNHKDVIFREAPDRRHFLNKLDEFCDRDLISIIAYCLMDNHFHLILRQNGPVPISRAMRSLLAGYTRMYNPKYGTVGSLFQGRFGSREVRDEYDLIRLSRYIHLNPAPFLDFRTYLWSSYRQYTDSVVGICDVGPVLDWFAGSKVSYAIFVEKSASSEQLSPQKQRRVAGRRVS